MAAIGLAGAGHCAGMCGGIATALGMASGGRQKPVLALAYNLGRIASYSIAGGLAATLGYWGREYLALGPLLRVFAGIILIFMGLYLADWWRGILIFEKAGVHLWRLLQPLSNRLLPVRTMPGAVLVGCVWGWLPCGLVYTALAYAAVAGSPLEGALRMTAFGLGTLPAMLLATAFSGAFARRLQDRRLRRVMALLMITFGISTLAGPVMHLVPGPGPAGQVHGGH
jgi:hypothetical protein